MSDQDRNKAEGLKRLVERYKEEFRQPENVKHYSHDDYTTAEKRYVCFRLSHG